MFHSLRWLFQCDAVRSELLGAKSTPGPFVPAESFSAWLVVGGCSRRLAGDTPDAPKGASAADSDSGGRSRPRASARRVARRRERLWSLFRAKTSCIRFL